MATLPLEFLRLPIAHRGLHGAGVPENSLAAFEAAARAGYAIECDVQRTADGVPVVFHDDDLNRLLGVARRISDCPHAEIAALRILQGNQQVPTLREVLDRFAGRVPLLIEIKDQDGGLGPGVGDLQDRVAELVRGRAAALAVMSFNPGTVARFHRLAPDIPAGLVTERFDAEGWPRLRPETRRHLAAIADFDRSGACFISHGIHDLASPAVARLKARGVPVLCWTVRSALQEAEARRIADNITFEGYLPAQ